MAWLYSCDDVTQCDKVESMKPEQMANVASQYNVLKLSQLTMFCKSVIHSLKDVMQCHCTTFEHF